MDKDQKRAYWEGIRTALLKHEPYIRQMLNEWRSDHPDWVCNFNFSDYPPTYHIEFARLQQGNRAGEAYDVGASGIGLTSGPVWVCALLTFEEVGIPEPVVTKIIEITGLKCKYGRKPGPVCRYKLWSMPQ